MFLTRWPIIVYIRLILMLCVSFGFLVNGFEWIVRVSTYFIPCTNWRNRFVLGQLPLYWIYNANEQEKLSISDPLEDNFLCTRTLSLIVCKYCSDLRCIAKCIPLVFRFDPCLISTKTICRRKQTLDFRIKPRR